MVLFIKLLLIVALSLIAYQDFKERLVWWFLFPLYAFLGSYLFYINSDKNWYLVSLLINQAIIFLILLVLMIYIRVIMKKRFFREAFGLGDTLFFMAFALSFPTISFICFFFFSILATLVFWVLQKKIFKSRLQTIPLAGCMSLFSILLYFTHWLNLYPSIYNM